MLNITKDQFMDLYKDTGVIPYIDIFYTDPESEEDFLQNYITSKLWRLNNLYTIVDKWSNEIPFNMRYAQHRTMAETLRHPRIIVLKSRQQGISTLWLVSFFDDCLFKNNTQSGLMAQGLDEASTLLGRAKLLWDNFPSKLKDMLDLKVTSKNESQIKFSNNSVMYVKTSFRSGTIQRLHVSEYGKIANIYPKKAEEVKSGSLQAIADGNTVVIESTAEGDNDFKSMVEKARDYVGELTPKDFKLVFLPWTEDPDCTLTIDQDIDAEAAKYFKELESEHDIMLSRPQMNFWIAKRRELGKFIYQEYPATIEEAFLKDKGGTYYAAHFIQYVKKRDRLIKGLYDPNLDVQVSIDLGMDDDFVMNFFQTYTDGFRIFDCYTHNGEDVHYYCKLLLDLKEAKGYNYSRIVLPHDANVRNNQTKKTVADVFRSYGFRVVVLERTTNLVNEIHLVRDAIREMWFDPKAQYAISCMLNYRKKKRRDASEEEAFGSFEERPEHDKYSHGADAIRYMVVGGEKYKKKVRNRRSGGMDV